MKPALTYSLARFGLLAAVFAALLPIPALSLPVKALLALLITMPLSWFLLRGMRERASLAMAEGLQRRRQRREELRAALAGDEPGAAGAEPGRQ